MRTILLGLFAIAVSLGLSQYTYAVCLNPGGTAPGGGNILNCDSPPQLIPLDNNSAPPNDTTGSGDQVNISSGGGVTASDTTPAINTVGGPDEVNVSGTITNDMDDGLETGNSGDTVVVNPGAVISGLRGIHTGRGADMVKINGGTITGNTVRAIGTGRGADLVVINDGTFNGPESIRTARGADTLRIFGGTFNGPIATVQDPDNVLIEGGEFGGNGINLGGDDDTINIAGDVTGLGLINCAGGDDNTIIFSLNVPVAELPALSIELANEGSTGEIIINGNNYSWANCQIVEDNLNGIVTILTLSPIGAVNPVSTEHTVTAQVSTNTNQNDNVKVFFEVTSGPNAGLNSETDGTCSPNPDCTTDANGETSWTYTGSIFAGVDTIVASIDDVVVGAETSNIVEKEWIVIRNVPTLSEWGLIAIATLLGIIGYMVVRRRQVAA